MPTIRVDDEVYERLKSGAEALVGTPNAVLRRVLGLEAAASVQSEGNESARTRRMGPAELLQAQVYDLPILSVLDGMGGAGYAPEVIDAVGKMVEESLTENDLMENRSGVVRWKSRVAWRRFHLVQLGLLKRASPRGTWEISEEGRDALVRWEITYPGRAELAERSA
jgi:negative regulator of replication initiation